MTRPLRPRAYHAPTYPTFRQPTRYRRYVGAFALAASVSLGATAYADPPENAFPTRTSGVAPVPTMSEQIPADGTLDLYLDDGSYAQVVVTLRARHTSDPIGDADVQAAIADHLSGLTCQALYTPQANSAVRIALRDALGEDMPTLEDLAVNVVYCEAGIEPAGQERALDAVPPVPADVELSAPDEGDDDGPKLDCRIPRRDLD